MHDNSLFCRLTGVIRSIGVRRVLFGSDWPWFSPLSAIRQIEGLGFSEDEKRMILGRNAARVFGLGIPDVEGRQQRKER